ncbi:SDR family NAD(P)-dependent oxidoreductase [Vibrio profundum]|uniref:SDR family NAD(P)-dependent oxidoreductase n=1 Tax=Vibrio profundum TaxID=2910247 RepID=UPI003D14AB6C
MMLKSVLITGSNAGLGKESAKQLAIQGVEKVYLGCRNEAKAKQAKQELEQTTGKSVFEIVLLDVSNLESVRSAVAKIEDPIEGLIMNAGGIGGASSVNKTRDSVTQIFAVNVLGHVVLAEELLKAGKLTKVGLFVGTEASRGYADMGMKKPDLATSSPDEFASIASGSFFYGPDATDPMVQYGPVKYVGTMWMSSLSRQYPDVRLITMSPGATTGTEGTSAMAWHKQIYFKVMMRVAQMMGKMHGVEVGAKRLVDGVLDDSYKTGIFYASKEGASGEICDQVVHLSDLANQEFQDNARQAVLRFIS